jgi:hypothetical protein
LAYGLTSKHTWNLSALPDKRLTKALSALPTEGLSETLSDLTAERLSETQSRLHRSVELLRSAQAAMLGLHGQLLS